MNNPINEQISALMSLKQQGMQPQQVFQMMCQQNPYLNQQLKTLQNMAQGKSPQEFIMQLANQKGLNQQSIMAIKQMLGK